MSDSKKVKKVDPPAPRSGMGRRQLIKIGGAVAAVYATPKVVRAQAAGSISLHNSSSPWVCRGRSRNTPDEVATWLLGELNELSGQIALTAKVSASNRENGEPFGIIYHWSASAGTPPTIPPSQSNFGTIVYNGDNQYVDMATKLDDLVAATETPRSAAAHCVITNANGPPARSGILFPATFPAEPPTPAGGGAWLSHEEPGSSLVDTYAALNAFINNTLTNMNGTATMKIGVADRSGGACRAIVVYRNNFVGSAALPTTAALWQVESFSTDSDYSGLYNAVKLFLNGIDDGSDEGKRRAAAAKLTFTNREGAPATIHVFYPTLTT